MTDMQAALGIHQLRRIGENHARREERSWARYDAGFAPVDAISDASSRHEGPSMLGICTPSSSTPFGDLQGRLRRTAASAEHWRWCAFRGRPPALVLP